MVLSLKSQMLIFSVLTATNEFYVIDTTNCQPGSTYLVEKTKDNIISLTVLLKTGLKLILTWGVMTTLALVVFCALLRVFLSKWSFQNGLSR